MDLWGPATVHDQDGKECHIHIVAMMDPATGWFECVPLRGNKTAAEAQRALDLVWTAQCPRPGEAGHNNGTEFKAEFIDHCCNMGLRRKPTASHNPQGNSVLERVHQALSDASRSFESEAREPDDSPELFKEFSTAAACAIQASCHSTSGHSPAQLMLAETCPCRWKLRSAGNG